MEVSERASKIVIGICGATRSGKTSVSDLLGSHFQIPSHCILHQDKFWLPIPERPKVKINGKLRANMEVPSSVDWQSLMSRLRSLIRSDSSHVIVIEGFLLYTNKELMGLIDYPIFLTISKQICYERRYARAVFVSFLIFTTKGRRRNGQPMRNLKTWYGLNMWETIGTLRKRSPFWCLMANAVPTRWSRKSSITLRRRLSLPITNYSHNNWRRAVVCMSWNVRVMLFNLARTMMTRLWSAGRQPIAELIADGFIYRVGFLSPLNLSALLLTNWSIVSFGHCFLLDIFIRSAV